MDAGSCQRPVSSELVPAWSGRAGWGCAMRFNPEFQVSNCDPTSCLKYHTLETNKRWRREQNAASVRYVIGSRDRRPCNAHNMPANAIDMQCLHKHSTKNEGKNPWKQPTYRFESLYTNKRWSNVRGSKTISVGMFSRSAGIRDFG